MEPEQAVEFQKLAQTICDARISSIDETLEESIAHSQSELSTIGTEAIGRLAYRLQQVISEAARSRLKVFFEAHLEAAADLGILTSEAANMICDKLEHESDRSIRSVRLKLSQCLIARRVGINEEIRQTCDDSTSHQIMRSLKAHVKELEALIAKERARKFRSQTLGARNDAEIDALTRLCQRGVFDRDADSAIKNAQPFSPLSLIMIDLDNFKEINDTFSHPVGDEVLRVVSRIVSESCRGKGMTYRYGGEELSVLLPNFTTQEAHAVSERIRGSVEACKVDAVTRSITVSCGVATAPKDTDRFDLLIRIADRRLYAAKGAGKNRVISNDSRPAIEPSGSGLARETA